MKTRITISLYTALQVPKVPRIFIKVFDGTIPQCDTMTIMHGSKLRIGVNKSRFDLSDEMIDIDYMNIFSGQPGWSKVGVDEAAYFLTESGWEEINE